MLLRSEFEKININYEEDNSNLYSIFIKDFIIIFIKNNFYFDSIKEFNNNIDLFKDFTLLIINLNNEKSEILEKNEKESNKFLKLMANSINWMECYKNEIVLLLKIYKILSSRIDNLYEKINEVIISFKNEYIIEKDNYYNIENDTLYLLLKSLIKILISNKNIYNNKDTKIINEYIEILENSSKIQTNLNLNSGEIFSFEEILEIVNLFKEKDSENMNNLKTDKNELEQEGDIEKYNNLMKIYNYLFETFGQNENFSKIIDNAFKNEFLKSQNKIFRESLLKFILKDNKLLINSSNLIELILDKYIKIEKEKIKENLKEIENEDFSLLKIIDQSENPFLDEILLNYFERKLNLYFKNISQSNISDDNFLIENELNQTILLNESFDIFKDSIKYLIYILNNENINNKNSLNNIIIDEEIKVEFYKLYKLYCISYIKKYLSIFCYFFMKDNNLKNDCIENIINYINQKIYKEEFAKIIKLYICKQCYSYMNNYKEFKESNFIINLNIQFDIEYFNEQDRKNMLIYYFLPLENDEMYQKYLDEYNKFEEYKEKEFRISQNINDFINQNNFDIFITLAINNIISNLGLNNTLNEKVYSSFCSLVKPSLEGNNLSNKNLNNLLLLYLDKNNFDNIMRKKFEKDRRIDEKLYIILLYSLRLCAQSLYNNNNLYASFINKNCFEVINNNFIPGNDNSKDLHLISLLDIENHFNLYPSNKGCYVCSCGFYYTIEYCGFPIKEETLICSNCNEKIGFGINNKLKEQKYGIELREGHYRIFKDEKEKNYEMNKYNITDEMIPNKTIKEYKKDIIEPILNREKKGLNIINEEDFLSDNKSVRKLSKIGYRLLNFLTYSHLFFANCLGFITENDLKKLLIENMTCLEIIENSWDLLSKSLKDESIQSIEIFMNLIFPKLSDLIKGTNSLNTLEERNIFEEKVELIIKECISNYNTYKIKYLNENYKYLKDQKNTPKIIIHELVPPEEYNEKEYPMFKYFLLTKYPNKKSFQIQFKKMSEKEYRIKYPLLSQFLFYEPNVKYLKFLPDINEFSNFMINKYSNKITREYAKENILKSKEISDDNEHFKKFINAMNKMKKYNVNYKDWKNMKWEIDNLKDNNNKIIYFLNDNIEPNYGMHIAAAYQSFISWQNGFLQPIIDSITKDGIHYFYLNNLKNIIPIQDAKIEQILFCNKIDLENEISKYSKRDIFKDDGTINYFNYNTFVYDFDLIEKELGKKLLQGKCLFNENLLRFISFKYENNSNILINFDKIYSRNNREINKNLFIKFIKNIDDYIQNEGKDDDKENNNEIKNNENEEQEEDQNSESEEKENEEDQNKQKELIKNILESLKSLIYHFSINIINENEKIKNIIYNLPNYIDTSPECLLFFQTIGKEFQINQLISIYLCFEDLYFDILKNTDNDYNVQIEDEIIEKIEIRFKNFKKKEELIEALKRYISRYLIGNEEIKNNKNNLKLIQQLQKQDLWDVNETNLNEIFKDLDNNFNEFDLTVEQSFVLFNLLFEINNEKDI